MLNPPVRGALSFILKKKNNSDCGLHYQIMKRENPEAAALAEISTFGLSETEKREAMGFGATAVGAKSPGSGGWLGPKSPSAAPLASSSAASVSSEAAVAAGEEKWVECDSCRKWRKLPSHVDEDALPEKWYCYMNKWDDRRNRCTQAEETTEEAAMEKEVRMKQQKSSHPAPRARSS